MPYKDGTPTLGEQIEEHAIRREHTVDLLQESIDLSKENDHLRAEIKRLNAKLSCGHRKIDWDNSYGGCAFCSIKAAADQHEGCPADVCDLQERIAELERQNAEVRALNDSHLELVKQQAGRIAELERALSTQSPPQPDLDNT